MTGGEPTPVGERIPAFIPRLRGQKVTAKVPGQPALNGTLTGFTPYEILIADDRGREHLVFKGAGLILDLPVGWRHAEDPGEGP